MNIKEVLNYLKIHGIRPLPLRVEIMKYLLENYNHPTIENIYNDLLPAMPTLSKTTVYNTLKLFCENKAARALFIDEKNVRYEAQMQLHAHFRCNECNAVYDVPLEKEDVAKLSGPNGISVDETHIYFIGKCHKCK